MNSKDKEIMNGFIKVRNLNKRTVYGYNNVIKLYTNFNNMSLSELLKEAEKDEEKGIRWKNRKIKMRLLNFRVFLQNNYLISTAKVHFQRILTIYRHFEIEIHNLPQINLKNANKLKPIMFEDLPTKEIIKDAINITNPIMQAIILFISSSGCARQETLNITIQDFIDATREYHDSEDIYEIITILIKRDDVVPTFKLKRQKTNKFYYTFCSPEAVTYILNYLIISKRKLKNEDKLFKTNLDYLNNYFNEINESLNLGKVRKYNRFRSHMLRKFHASILYNHENGLSLEEIDALQGRGKNNTHASYFMENPKNLKEKYINSLKSILIFN
ncbi:site-specific integrase [Methanobrevibacter smithii]|uniref:site-specific integrase n=1 Tax=Methanobrevibacter smithii TaxID=2173 RepID=UPI0037DC987B